MGPERGDPRHHDRGGYVNFHRGLLKLGIRFRLSVEVKFTGGYTRCTSIMPARCCHSGQEHSPSGHMSQQKVIPAAQAQRIEAAIDAMTDPHRLPPARTMSFRRNQKAIRRPNCIARGCFWLVDFPNRPLDRSDVGCERFMRLNRLKISPRSSTVAPSLPMNLVNTRFVLWPDVTKQRVDA
jgi:hypothetical protein